MPVLAQHFLGRVFQFTHRKTQTRLHSTYVIQKVDLNKPETKICRFASVTNEP